MKKVYKLENLGCANCAAKMETAIGKLEGVQRVSINFMTQKLTLEADDAAFEQLLAKAQQQMTKFERDCRIILK